MCLSVSLNMSQSFGLNAQLLLMKRGGLVIYGGKLGVHSQIMIDYFQVTINRPVLYF